MAISEPRPSNRTSVGWYGEPEPAIKAFFRARQLDLIPCTDENFSDTVFLTQQIAIIFAQKPQLPGALMPVLTAHAGRLLDLDCQVIVIAITADKSINGASRNLATRFAGLIANLKLTATGVTVFPEASQKEYGFDPGSLEHFPHVRFYSEFSNWNEITNDIVSIRPSKAPNLQLQITHDQGIALSEDYLLFLQRAFYDCSDVHLVQMVDEGRSGGVVFRAYADLQGDVLGSRWPQPYFVKIGPRAKIVREYKNYGAVVNPYIPFHLGPHLVDSRCQLGANLGILVGDFVEKSESLGGCAAHGRAVQAIGHLFTTTLEGWYRTATETENTRLSAYLRVPLKRWAVPRLNRAFELGATKQPSELAELFKRSDSTSTVLLGPIHGDLHAANVLVRANDAIVIDFFAHRNLPLVYDAACLEASLVVDGFEKDERDIATWLRSILPLYSLPFFERAPASVHPKDESAWFYACVSQIRLHARQMERGRGQYAAALAVALLTKANKDSNAPEPNSSRRAAAYALAESVLVATFGAQVGRVALPAAPAVQ